MILWTKLGLKITKKGTITSSYKNNYRILQKEVGMAVLKSIQTRVVGMILTNTTGIPTLHTYVHTHIHNSSMNKSVLCDASVQLVAGPYPSVRLVGIYLITVLSTNHRRRAHYTLAGYVWTMNSWNLMIIYNAYTSWRLRNVPLMSEIKFLTLWAVRARRAVDDGWV